LFLRNENTDPDYVAPEIDIAEETDNAS